MLLAPSDKPYDYRKPPRLALGLAGLLLLLAFTLFPGDFERQRSLDSFYVTNLMSIEWPLYSPFLMQNNRSTEIAGLEAQRTQGNQTAVAQAMGNDRPFVESIRAGGKDYLEPDILSRWTAARDHYDQERNRLSAQVIGLDPQRFRPVTFISYAFTDTDLNNVLLTVVLLLLVGMPLERVLGSGALLASWTAGSAAGGLAYLLLHRSGLMPLTGSSHAIAGLLGAAIWEFRRNRSLRVMESAVTAGGWLFMVISLAALTLIWHWHSREIAWIVSLSVSLAAGATACAVFRRWLEKSRAEQELEIVVPEMPTSEPYRQDLNQVMLKVSQMQFVAAEKNIRALLERYPGDPRLTEQLYHLLKLTPNNLEFEEVAFAMLTLPNQPGSNQASLRVYRDYIKRSQTFVALDTNTSLQLVLRFTRINALKDAEEAFKRALDSDRNAPLLAKAANALATAMTANNMEQRAGYYAGLAKSGD